MECRGRPTAESHGVSRAGMDVTLLRAHHGPTALRFVSSHDRHLGRIGAPHTVAMRHLIEAILCHYRPDSYGFEQRL